MRKLCGFSTSSLLSFTFFVSIFVFLPSAAAVTLIPAHSWSRVFGDPFLHRADAATTDSDGNVYIAGNFRGTVNFGGGDLVSVGFPDIFLAKFNANGVHQWSRRFGDTNGQDAFGLATDAAGNVYMAGEMNGTLNFGGTNLTSAGNFDIFLVKFDAAGVHQWSQRFGDSNYQQALSVAADASGNVYLTGIFVGTANFGGGNLVDAGNGDIYLARFNTNGVHQWSQRFGDAVFAQAGQSVATDPSGYVFLAGYFGGTMNLGGGNLTSAGGSNDIFLARFSPAGAHQWSKRFGDALSSDVGRSVATDGIGSVYLTGHFGGTVNFGGDSLIGAGGFDIFLAKFSPTGIHQWSRGFGDASEQIGVSVAAAVDKVCMTGYMVGTVNFGGGNLTSAGSGDVFLAEFNWAGVPLWSQRFGDSHYQEGTAVAMDASENTFVAGYFYGTLNFGGGDLTAGDWQRIFLARFEAVPREPVIASIEDVGNDQGRKVRLRFQRSAHDWVGSILPVTRYEAYRRNDPITSATVSRQTGTESPEQLLAMGWVPAGEVPAHAVGVYGLDAPTDADSTIAGGPHYSAFFIRAATADNLTYFDSPVDSGYSIDNLAPGVPESFAYDAGLLTWTQSSAADFDHFTVYGSSTGSFGSAIAIDHTTAPSMDVTLSPCAFYFVTATDRAGNEGAPATANSLLGSGGPPTRYVLSISSHPNPFNPTTAIRYTLPSHGQVSIAIYDARGALVSVLVDEEKDAGAYSQTWDGRNDIGRAVGSGVYFARLSHPSGTKSYKLLLLK